MSDQENKQQGAESVEENTETVKTESAETSVPESGATPPAEEKNAEGRDGKEKGHRRELQKAKEEIEKLKAEAEDFKRKWYSVTAEYDNYRRRSTREREAIYADVRCDTLKKFMPVYDSLSRALAQTPDDDPARKGLEGIMNQYNTALNQLGVTAIEAVGQPFDANRHNAVMHIEDDAYGEGVVVEEFEKGFCIGDRVLRYSVVKVAN